MKENEFNLIREPWILVMKPSGEVQEVSLMDAFRRAPEFQCLAGELPTQDVAVMRLLLAIMHAVFARYNTAGDFSPIYFDDKEDRIPTPRDALERWRELWDLGSFPMKIIEEYLAHYEDRFYLFHPEYPFYQVAELGKSTVYGAAKLNGEISESSNKVRLFSQRNGLAKKELTLPEGARWLLHVNAFDDTSAKPKTKGLPSPGAGWLGKLGLVYAVGNNLFETLMLNYIVLKRGGNELWSNEKPIWESEHIRSEERQRIIIPDNLSELYTLQSRRLLLKRNKERVTGYSLLGGDFFVKENSLNEPMTVWRNANQKKDSIPEYHPKRHDPSRQIWRGLSSISVQNEGIVRPGIVDWQALLHDKNLVSKQYCRFQVVSVVYGDKDFFVENIFCDSISFSAGLLTSMGREWMNRIIAEIETTEKLVQEVGRLKQKIAKASGHKDSLKQYDMAKEQAYYLLDVPFRRWLARIDPVNDEMSTLCDVWWEKEKAIIRDLGKRMIMNSGSSSFVGREVTDKVRGKELTQRYTSPEAYNSFLFRTSTREKVKGGKLNDG